MRLTTLSRSLLALSLLALIGCNPNSAGSRGDDAANDQIRSANETPAEKAPDEAADEVPTANPKATDKVSIPDTKDRPKPITPAIAPGTYCYQMSDKNQDISARITLDGADRVTGNLEGVVHNEENAYYTSYRRKLDGTIDGGNLNLDVATWIEFDKQNSQETWKVTTKGLSTERETLSLTGCEPTGLEADDLTKNANRVREMDVFFDAGKSSTTLSNAVVRGDRDLYRLIAQGGQQMTLSISALEDNAAFGVVSPSGVILTREAVEEKLYLPETGAYEIIVGGTRGSATYDLALSIE